METFIPSKQPRQGLGQSSFNPLVQVLQFTNEEGLSDLAELNESVREEIIDSLFQRWLH